MSTRSSFVLAAALVVLATACGDRQAQAPRIFWSESPRGGEEQRGTVRSVGAGDMELIRTAKAPAGVAVDDRYVYWANYGSGTIGRARLDGSKVDNRFIVGADDPIGVAVDDGHVYWTNTGIEPNSGTIGRANIDGSDVDQHFIRAGDSAKGLAVDGGHIYWTHRDWLRTRVGGNWIGRANLDGSHVQRHFIAVSNEVTGVAVNDRYVFWSNSGEDAIGRASLDGTDVDQRCISPRDVPLGNVPEGLAVDGSHVYWTNYPANTVARATLNGSALDERFTHVEGVPEGIAVSGDSSSASTGACRDRSKRPLLLGTRDYLPAYYAAGWGEAAPAVVSNGGASASGTIYGIHWSTWGGKVAVGRGLHPTFKPRGGYYRRPVVIELRASQVRSCKPGRPFVYTRFTVRDQVRPGGPMGKWYVWARNMCVSYFR